MTSRGPMTALDSFRLDGRVFVITGAAGLLGRQHASAIAEAGGIPVLTDVDLDAASGAARELTHRFARPVTALRLDVTDPESCQSALGGVLDRFGRLDGLVNNAASNPQVGAQGLGSSRFEHLSLETWRREIDVGLTGAFLTSQVFGSWLAEHGGGAIVNVASDLGLIAPDQRIYRRPDLPPAEQPAKPATYSAIKGGLVMLTKYLATYWADQNVRVNALCPGGVYVDQPAEFVERLTNLIPLGRMARRDEYKAAVVFLCSDASSYMTGANLVVDGGRTCW